MFKIVIILHFISAILENVRSGTWFLEWLGMFDSEIKTKFLRHTANIALRS